MRQLTLVAIVLIGGLIGLVHRGIAQTSTPGSPTPPSTSPPSTTPGNSTPKTFPPPKPDMTWAAAGSAGKQTLPAAAVTTPFRPAPSGPTHLPAAEAPKPAAGAPVPAPRDDANTTAGPLMSGPALDAAKPDAAPTPVFSPPPAPNPTPAAGSGITIQTNAVPPTPIAPAVAPESPLVIPATPTRPELIEPPSSFNRTAPSQVVLTGAQTPTVYLEKVGPAAVSVGKPLIYEIVARNTGSATVFNVRIEDQLPGGAKFLNAEPKPDAQAEHLVWNIGNMDAGAERRIKVEIQPTGEGELSSSATVTFSATSGLKTQITKPKVTLTLAGPETVQVSDPTALQIQIANVGTGPATNLVLHANLPIGLSHEKGSKIDADLGTLAPGESRAVPLPTMAVKAGRQTTEISINGDEGVQASAQAVVLVTEPILTLKGTGPRRRYLNREAQFVLEVANAGTGRAANVRVADILGPGLEFVSASDGGLYDPASRTIAWNLSLLTPGQRQTLTVRAATRTVGTLINQAAVRDERGVETKIETAVQVEGVIGLLFEVVDVEDAVTVGGEIGYEIRVLNQGTAAATGVQIMATLPPGLAVKNATGPTPYRIQGQQVIFDPLPTLAPRADSLYRLALFAQQPGDMRLKVQLTSDQVKMPINKEESTHVYSDPDELVTSTSSGAWKPDAEPGDGKKSP